MSYNRDTYEEAMSRLKRRHDICAMKSEERRRLLTESNPRFSEIEAELRQTAPSIAAILREGRGRDAFDKVMERNKSLRAEREKLLADAGLSADYLDEIPNCDKCGDEYYTDGKMCDCLKNELRIVAYEKLNKASHLKPMSFDDFDLGYYSDDYDEGLDESPREHMESVFKYVRSFAGKLGRGSESLLFIGGTGLGKTHLSLAAAKEAIDSGLGVIYDSVPSLMMKLENERFGRGDDGLLEMVCSCDLLILDDLGAEHNTNTTRTFIYTIVNSRIMSGLPTVISTNLGLSELRDSYTDAVYSRLSGDYTPIYFSGSDIRLKKKMGIK